jgi:uncharacterized delta-60 repeat protein/MYXO-CTERM domain-containing protein
MLATDLQSPQEVTTVKKSKQRKPADATRIRLVGPTAALATGLLSSPVGLAAPGDLDPGFGDVGRSTGWPGTTGSLWALQPMPDDDLLFSGCGTYYTDCLSTAFTGRLDQDGSLDRLLSEALLGTATAYDFALQPDGKVVAAGETRSASGTTNGVVVRLQPDGSRDRSFGTDGVVQLIGPGPAMNFASSVAMDPQGRIVVAGPGPMGTVAVRLLPSGAIDLSFGASGVFVNTQNSGSTSLVALKDGGYRMLVSSLVGQGTSMSWRCRVQALTSGGQVDTAYGEGGLSPLDATPTNSCNDLAADPSGRLVISGQGSSATASSPVLRRLTANGAADTTFDAAHVSVSMTGIDGLAIDATGRIVITGQDKAGDSGILVSRLKADGQLDPAFGQGGTSRVAVRGLWPDNFWVHDLQLLRDGGIVIGGGAWINGGLPFVMRLLGDASAGGPGVLGFKQGDVQVSEADGRAVLRVERIAGRSGPVSVDYATVALEPGVNPAAANADYLPVQGRLSWAAGDDSDREIVVPIVQDTDRAESGESFLVELRSVEGSGLAVERNHVGIRSESGPAGLLSAFGSSVAEGKPATEVVVCRHDYVQGGVSVLLSVTGGTARKGRDFKIVDPVRVKWRDGEPGCQPVGIEIIDDNEVEPTETIELALSDPTGGALLGAGKTLTIQIADNDTSSGGVGGNSGGGGGGGGNGGGLLALLAAAGAWLRRRRREL